MPHHMKPKIALSLGSGSARGWAHIGIIKRLLELGIKPDIVTGSSVGALVGGAYACGNLEKLEKWVTTLGRFDILRLLDPRLSGGGFMTGNSLMSAIAEHVADVAIEDLPVPFACVATDLNTGLEVWLNDGSVLEAIRASIALPGLFTPVHYEGRWLTDGGLVNPVPVSLARAMGADIIIAVNLNGELVGRSLRPREPIAPVSEPMPEPEPVTPELGGDDSTLGRLRAKLGTGKASFDNFITNLRKDTGPVPPGLFDVLAASINIMQDRITRSRMAGDPPDIVISPRLSQIRLMEFDRAREAIDEGVAAVDRRRDELNVILEPHGHS